MGKVELKAVAAQTGQTVYQLKQGFLTEYLIQQLKKPSLKKMQDHSLFQDICRMNRLDGSDKEYGHIIDYKDLFKSPEVSYPSGEIETGKK